MERKFASTNECAKALRQLSDADLRRLTEVGQIRVTGLQSLDGQDLLHEAIARMLGGQRQWPLDVPLVVFLLQTMRSIASDCWRRQEASVVVSESTVGIGAEATTGELVIAEDLSTSPEACVSAQQVLDYIEDLFQDDHEALSVITGMASGKSPSEIQRENAIDKRRYATTQRRIRRGLSKLFQKLEH